MIKIQDKTIRKIAIGEFVGILLILTGVIIYNSETTYYCSDNDLVGECFKLSGVNDEGLRTRCYYNQSSPKNYKNCKSGWTDIKDIINTLPKAEKVIVYANNGKYECQINNGIIQSYTKCLKDDKKEAYIGELI